MTSQTTSKSSSSSPPTHPPPRRPVVLDPSTVLSPKPTSTQIDRRTCHRTVPLQVLCLGPSRTGTSTLRQALLDLGYSDVYHYASIFNENPLDAAMWVDAFRAKFEGETGKFEVERSRKDWDKLLGHCAAVTDTPCVVFWRELLRVYPEAKVVLTVRDGARQWWESQMGSVMLFWRRPGWRKRVLMGLFGPEQGGKKDPHQELLELLPRHYEMYRLLLRDMEEGTERAMEWYERYVEEVKSVVPRERLLVMNVKEGWDPLCRFLGKEKPGWEWPRANTREWFVRSKEVLDETAEAAAKERMWRSVGWLASVGVIGGLGWWLSRIGW
ncbi:MAG: hypothetical protein Q9227_003731 [Pyrenula ochraceoflavens]